jgi:hypothetical protein
MNEICMTRWRNPPVGLFDDPLSLCHLLQVDPIDTFPTDMLQSARSHYSQSSAWRRHKANDRVDGSLLALSDS